MKISIAELIFSIDFPFEIRSRIGIRVGARMGKPEGSKHREMKPAIHTMHPLGFNVGAQRLVDDAVKDEGEVQVGIRWDTVTGEEVTTGFPMERIPTTWKWAIVN